jgi:type II restriction enzyme
MTRYQETGTKGEQAVKKYCLCPECSKGNLRLLRPNFKCADVICDFCGFLAQVKARNIKRRGQKITRLLGAAWKPQKERMEAGIIFPLFIVDILKDRPIEIHYLDRNSQENIDGLYLPRKPLSRTARRAGWQGFYYDLSKVQDKIVTIWELASS